MLNRHRLSFKVLNIVYILFIVAILVIYTYIFTSNGDRQTKNDYIVAMEKVNQQLVYNMELMIKNIQNISAIHILDDNINKVLVASEQSETMQDYYEEVLDITKTLSAIVRSNPVLVNIFYIINDKVIVSVSNYEIDEAVTKRGIEKVESKDFGNIYLSNPFNKDGFTLEIMTLIKKVYDKNNMTTLGYVGIDIDFDKFIEELRRIANENINNQFVLVGQDGTVLYQSNTKEPKHVINKIVQEVEGQNSTKSFLDINKSQYLIVSNKEKNSKWRIIQYTSTKHITNMVIENIIKYLAVFIVVVVGITLFSEYVLHTLYKRLKKNINQTYIAEVRRKDAELEMLQHQINPHFLYNTLNLISSIAYLENVPQIELISKSLSDLFRYNVKGDKIVTIKEELDYIKKYMLIQQHRFPNKIEVSYEFNQEILNNLMMKFLLQPIIENAVSHGIGKINRKGIIVINGEQENNRTIISIYDNGIGMDQESLSLLKERLKQVSNSDKEVSHRKHIGLMNVHRRIVEYYGGEFGVSIESKFHNYTKVYIIIPTIPNGYKQDN